MAISGLVITLDEDPHLHLQALEALRADGRLELGTPCGNRLPVVVATADATEGEAVVEELFTWPGIQFVDLVCVDFTDEEP